MRRNAGCWAIGCGAPVLVAVGLFVFVTFFRATAFWLSVSRPTESQLIESLGGAQVAEVIKNSQRTEIALIEPPDDKQSHPANEFVETVKSQEVPTTIAADLRRILLDPNENLHDETAKGCVPRYGVRVRFVAGQDRVDVYFCFECAIMEFYFNDKPVGGNDFELAYRQLISDIRKIYPAHEGLAKLKARWRL